MESHEPGVGKHDDCAASTMLVLCCAGGSYKPPEKQIDAETEAAVSKYVAGLLRPMYKAQKLKKEHYKVRG